MVFGRITGFIGFLFSYRRKVFKLRKSYDRAREKADRLRDREKRLHALKVLDQIEPTMIILEEQKVSRFERARMFNYVKSGINEAKKIMKEEYRPVVMQTPYRK